MAVSQRIYLDHNATSPLRPEAGRGRPARAAAARKCLVRPCRRPGRTGRNRERPRESGPSRRRPGEERRLHQRRHRGCQSRPDAKLPPPRAAGDDPAPPGSDRASLRSQRPPVSRGCRRAHPGRFGRDPRSGLARGTHLAKAGDERVLVSVQLANNETGVIQPVAEVGPDRSRAWRAGAYRCGPGGGQDPGRHGRAWGRCADPVRPQDRRPEGSRRRDPRLGPVRDRRPADPRRRAGKGLSGRHRERGGHRRLRRGGRACRCRGWSRNPPGSGGCATWRRPSFAGSRPMSLLWLPALSGCLIPSPLPYPASKPRRR